MQSNWIIKGMVILCVLLISIMGVSASLGARIEDYRAHREKVLAPLSEGYERICREQRDNPAIITFQERLSYAEEVTELIVSEFENIRQKVLADLLDDMSDDSKSPYQESYISRIRATEVYTKYSPLMPRIADAASLAVQDRQILRDYYVELCKAAEDFILREGVGSIAFDETASQEIAGLYVVLPFLHIPDDSWREQNVDGLPKWMSTDAVSRGLEQFALSIKRPLTAYEFYRSRQKRSKKNELRSREDYCLVKAKSFADRAEYDTSIYCYKKGIELADSAELLDKAIVGRLMLARLYDQLGYPLLSAEHVKDAMQKGNKSDKWGQAALKRLIYLYKGEAYDTVLKESAEYEKDERCAIYVPQMKYVLWLTLKKQEKPHEARELAGTFLEQYPKHPLCADVFYASAIEAIQDGKLDQARLHFETIEERWPDSPVSAKARKMSRSLASMSQ